MSAETTWRLLDVGEAIREGDEILSVGGWTFCECSHTALPVRRPDDGKGKYLVACGFDMMVADFSGTEYWKWGVGWVRWTPEITDWNSETIWRKAREVEKPPVEPSPGNWLVAVDDDCWPFPTEAEATTWAREIARNRDEGTLVRVAKIIREIQIKVEFVEREVGK